MSFKKYNSIENSYNSKYISKVLADNPELASTKYVVTEKIDGANIQIYITPNAPRQVGSRNQWLQADADFYDIWNVLEQFKTELTAVQDFSNRSGRKIRLYGEVYGPQIQRRITYNNHKSLIFFDVEVDDILYAPIDSFHFLTVYDLPKVPILKFTPSLTEALAVSADFPTVINPIEGNMSEGTVVRPFNLNCYDKHGGLFILKNKSDKFREKEHKKQSSKQVDSEAARLNLIFRDFINENRVLSIYSKHGPIKETSQLSDYIKYVLEDAKIDFLKENDISHVDKKQEKLIYNVGDSIVKLLMKEIKK